MNIFEILNSYGITTTHLQLGILAAVVIALVAVYWKLIVIGIGMLFCVVVFAMPDGNVTAKIPTNPKVGNAPLEYINDCKRYTGHTESECKRLWVEERSELDELR
jgi:uncharacterized membrane protein YagU involved in acid resistance